jgi:hypothetical protein
MGEMQPPTYIPSAAAVPGAPAPTQIDPGIRSIGIASVVLAILQLVWGLFQTISSVAALPMLHMQKKAFATGPAGSASPELTQMMDRMQDYMVTFAVWGSVRQLIFMIASAVLLYVAVRLMRGSPEALPLARKWSWGALAVLGVSVLIQAAILVPSQLDYQNHVFDSVPGGASGAPTIMSSMETFTTVWAVIMMIGGAVIMAIWPIVLRFWADKAEEKYRELPVPDGQQHPW